MSSEIDIKIRKAKAELEQSGLCLCDVTATEFYDYLTGEIFSEDTTTLQDVLNSEYLMIHELAEICELKKMGQRIDKKVIMEAPRDVIYTAHFHAIETELEYALHKRDTFWAKVRLRQHKESVVDDDPNLPEELRPRAEKIYTTYCRLVREMAKRPVTT